MLRRSFLQNISCNSKRPKLSKKTSSKSTAGQTKTSETGNLRVEFPIAKRMLGRGTLQSHFLKFTGSLTSCFHEKGGHLSSQNSILPYQDLKDKQTEPPCTHLGECGRVCVDTLSKQSGRGAGTNSTVAHASQRMATVCSLTLQEPVKYVLSAKTA